MSVDGQAGIGMEEAGPRPSVGVASIDAGRLAYIRCVLAFTALAVVLIAPSEPEHLLELTYGSIGAYSAFALAVSVASARNEWLFPPRALHWLDVAFYSYLICLTEGTQSIFFYCFFFPIMVASFSYGFREGLLVALASTGAFLSLGILATPWDAFDLNRLLLRPVYLLTLSYLIVYWGGCEVQFKRQLMLLQTIGNSRNPRRGVAFTITDSLERLRHLYDADRSILVMSNEGGDGPAVYSSTDARARPNLAEARAHSEGEILLAVPDQHAITYHSRQHFGFRRASCNAWNVRDRLCRCPVSKPWCEQAAEFLKAKSFVSVPYAQHDGKRGRIYVASRPAFTSQDAAFILHFSQTLSILAENIQLVDELVATAAERERSRVALDIHDTTIQPYIGLRMGLHALYREADEDSAMKASLQEMIAMADLTVRDLREYAADLRRTTRRVEGGLAAAVNEQAARFERFYGVKVSVEIDDLLVPDRLVSDALHIIIEGLSNIRRHTKAHNAYVRVARTAIALQIHIGNEAGGHHVDFTPRSIRERAQSVGGTVRVALTDGYVVVNASVPL